MLFLQFEDLVLKYEATVETIRNFLELDEIRGKDLKRYFDPGISAANIGIWKNKLSNSEAMAIEQNLRRYLYQC